MAGATAFFTTFALPPIVFIIAQLFSLFMDRRLIGRGLLERIANTLGRSGAEQIRDVMRSIRGFSNSWLTIILGFVFLIFVATTLFGVIINSLNQIWQIGVRQGPESMLGLRKRVRSFLVIMLIGILFFADLLFDSLATLTRNYVDAVLKGDGQYFKAVISELVSLVIVSAWFTLLFRYLADGRPQWRAALVGGILTGFLFSAGRSLLRYLLVDSNVGKLYGSSASLVLVLLFVFYSSFMLYYGGCFIMAYSNDKHWPFRLNKKAYYFKIEEVAVQPTNEESGLHENQ
jgi:membrane protein